MSFWTSSTPHVLLHAISRVNVVGEILHLSDDACFATCRSWRRLCCFRWYRWGSRWRNSCLCPLRKHVLHSIFLLRWSIRCVACMRELARSTILLASAASVWTLAPTLVFTSKVRWPSGGHNRSRSHSFSRVLKILKEHEKPVTTSWTRSMWFMKYLSIILDVELLRLGILRDSLLCKAITCVVHRDRKYGTIPNASQQVQEVTEKADTSEWRVVIQKGSDRLAQPLYYNGDYFNEDQTMEL